MERLTINVKEAADYLGVCTDTIYTMVRKNPIQHKRVRRRIFFRNDGLDQWMIKQEKKIDF
jgi:excisionase family DNA binding protein